MQSKKIFNDPVYGFISFPFELIYQIIDHRYFQRLRRIKQLGLTNYVFPGAQHTRFQHAIGAVHLAKQAIETLRSKGNEITDFEAEAVMIAVLLHDIGHGPYSHTLENCLVSVHHEEISLLFMQKLNDEFEGKLQCTIEIFTNRYPKKFLHQLVSSQLDVDRMDYINRDSFFSGVHEGTISSERLIRMMDVRNEELVIEQKGIYSVENFIISRRLMYWQVYLHKTVICAEQILVNILKRAKYLSIKGENLWATPALNFFLRNSILKKDFENDLLVLENFSQLDDFDIFTAIKVWTKHSDKVLSYLCHTLVERKLFRIRLENNPPDQKLIDQKLKQVSESFGLSKEESDYLVFTDSTSNSAYNPHTGKINILFKDGKIMNVADASDQLNIPVLSEPVVKYFLCYPKELDK